MRTLLFLLRRGRDEGDATLMPDDAGQHSNPRLSGFTAKAGPSGFRSPEEEELEAKREELQRLQSELVESELQLANLRSELIVFERKYMEIVGSRYAELDNLEARIAEQTAHQNPTDASAQREAESARARAQESAEALGDSGRRSSGPDFEPTEALQKLYRQAARELHPDLTTDEGEKARRQKAMAEVNKAYEECDEERIRQILDEWRSSPDQIRGDDTAAELVRVIRQIAQIRKRLDAIGQEIVELRQSELSQLKSQVDEATAAGRDLLAEMADRVTERIDEAKTRLESLLSR